MNFTGKYEGTLWYGEGYPANFAHAELTFQMEIEAEENSFVGTAHDTGGVGTSPDRAEVAGIISENLISFEKVYRRLHYADDAGNTQIDDKRQGFPILYEGVFNPVSGFYEGNWKYNVVRRYFFFFKKPFDWGSGTFRLKRVVT